MYEGLADLCCYAGTTVLKNMRGLREQAALDRFETIATAKRAGRFRPESSASGKMGTVPFFRCRDWKMGTVPFPRLRRKDRGSGRAWGVAEKSRRKVMT